MWKKGGREERGREGRRGEGREGGRGEGEERRGGQQFYFDVKS